MSLVTEILADSPYLYWTFDENNGGTTVFDFSGNGRGATLGSGVPVQTADGDAPTGCCRAFSGSSQYIYTTGFTPNVYAYETWFYKSAAIDTSVGPWAVMGSAAIATPILYLGGSVTGSVASEVITMYGNTHGSAVTGITIPVGWHHVVARWTGSQYDIFLDGAKQAVTTWGSPALLACSGFIVASTAAGSNYFPGRVAHAVMYDASLSEARIYAHWLAGRAAAVNYSDLITATRGCIGYWPLAAAGTVDGRKRNTVTFTATPTSAVGPEGASGTATLFNGSSQYGATPTDAAFAVASRPVAWEAWVRRDSGSGLASPLTCSTSGTIAPFGFDTFGTGGNNKWRAYVTGNSGGVTYIAAADSTSYDLGRWYHLAATFNAAGPNITLYVNGVQAGTSSSSSGSRDTGTYSMQFARFNSTTSQYWPGAIAHAAVYDRVLTATEIQQHYQAGPNPRGVAVSY